MSRWMVRLLTPNRSAKAASVIPGSVRQAWVMASRRSAGLAGRPDRAPCGSTAGRFSRSATAASATVARDSVAAASTGSGCGAVAPVVSEAAGWKRQPSRSRSSRCTPVLPSFTPVARWTTIATRVEVHTSPSKPWAPAPFNRASSIAGSWLSGIAGRRPAPPLSNAALPPDCQRARHTVAVCLATPTSSATFAAERPSRNSSTARARTACRWARWRAPFVTWGRRRRRRDPFGRQVHPSDSGATESRSGAPGGRPRRNGSGSDRAVSSSCRYNS
jgi:hypothetical protein